MGDVWLIATGRCPWCQYVPPSPLQRFFMLDVRAAWYERHWLQKVGMFLYGLEDKTNVWRLALKWHDKFH